MLFNIRPTPPENVSNFIPCPLAGRAPHRRPIVREPHTLDEMDRNRRSISAPAPDFSCRPYAPGPFRGACVGLAPLGHQDRVASLDGGERAAGGCAPRRRSGPASERARRRCARDPIPGADAVPDTRYPIPGPRSGRCARYPIPGADAVPDTRYRTNAVPDTRYPERILCPIPDTRTRSCARYPISAPSGELGLTFDRGYPQNRPSIRYQQSSCRTRISYVGVLTNGCRSPITVRYGQQQ